MITLLIVRFRDKIALQQEGPPMAAPGPALLSFTPLLQKIDPYELHCGADY